MENSKLEKLEEFKKTFFKKLKECEDVKNVPVNRKWFQDTFFIIEMNLEENDLSAAYRFFSEMCSVISYLKCHTTDYDDGDLFYSLIEYVLSF